MNIPVLLAVIQPAGLFSLRIFATIAALTFAAIGVAIYRRRHQLFDRDPEVINDTPAARHVRVEAVAIVWTGVMLALLGVLFEVWHA
jgi:amino acid transporter